MPPQQSQPNMLSRRSIIAKRRHPMRVRQHAPAVAAGAAKPRAATAAADETAGSPLRERIHLLEQANAILRDEQATHVASSRAYAHQIATLQAELRRNQAEFELERQRLSRRGMKFLGDLQRKMRRVAELKETLAAERQGSGLALEDLRGELEDARLHVGMLTAEAALEGAELESRVHRCALQTTYKMLASLDERDGLVRILQLCREYFTNVAATNTPGGSGGGADPVITPQQIGIGSTTTPRRRMVYLRTPVSLNRQTEEDLDGRGHNGGCAGANTSPSPAAAAVQGGNDGAFTTPRTNRPRVNEYGSPILQS